MLYFTTIVVPVEEVCPWKTWVAYNPVEYNAKQTLLGAVQTFSQWKVQLWQGSAGTQFSCDRVGVLSSTVTGRGYSFQQWQGGGTHFSCDRVGVLTSAVTGWGYSVQLWEGGGTQFNCNWVGALISAVTGWGYLVQLWQGGGTRSIYDRVGVLSSAVTVCGVLTLCKPMGFFC